MVDSRYDDPRLTAVGLLMETASGLRDVLHPQLAAAGLTDTTFEVLIRLARTPGQQLRMADLAAQTALSTSGVTRVVDRLEKEGLVERVLCQVDRRGLWAQLTSAGRDRVDEVLPGHLELIDAWLTGRLTSNQMDGLTEALRLVRAGVRPGAEAGVSESERVARVTR